MQTRRVPMRKCIGCNEMKEKKDLVRVVRAPDGLISLDLTGRSNGRGAYVCRDALCLQAARKAKRLEKAFGCAVPANVYDRLEEELNSHE